MLELDSRDALVAHLDAGGTMQGVVLNSVDLRGDTELLLDAELHGAVFLGCEFEVAALQRAVAHGAIVFPDVPDVPFATFRPSLYTPEELYAGFSADRPESYADTLDARVWAHYRATGRNRPPSMVEALARRVHDLSMTEGVDAFCDSPHPVDGKPRRLVAIMGGHGLPRDRGPYLAVARIARTLTRRGFTVVSGGGPGAMEATHLGAWFATRHDHDLLDAVDHLAAAPTYRHERWLATAFEIRARFPLEAPERCQSLGIPTWLYGHEPPNPFATHIAKYFANSVREDGIVTVARHGIIFSPGSAGTIQEIFQDACQNHYRTEGMASPMIFLGEGYWSWTKPVFPLLAQLAAGHEYASLLRITDDEDQVVAALEAFAASLASDG